ncbi:MAG: ABC transporter substrate-binding protein [Gemmatimonadota bacterium]
MRVRKCYIIWGGALLPTATLGVALAFAVPAVAQTVVHDALQTTQRIDPIRIGLLYASLTGESSLTRGSPRFQTFCTALNELGYFEAEQIIFEARTPETRRDGALRPVLEVEDDLRRLTRELVDARVNLIVAGGSTEALMAQQAAPAIPIVFWSQEPLAEGLIDSYERPGRNATGITVRREAARENLELASQLGRGNGPIGILINPGYLPGVGVLRQTREAAAELGVPLEVVEVHGPVALEGAFAKLASNHVRAVVVMNHGMFRQPAQRLAELQVRHRLPVLSPYRETAEAGVLVSWMPDFRYWSRRAAVMVDRVLKGARPGDIPVEQSVPYLYTVNLKTARTLGITVPETLLRSAANVIR